MSDDEDGGERTNAEYYSRFWTKPMKVRSAAKRVKPKRSGKKVAPLSSSPNVGNRHRRYVELVRKLPTKSAMIRLKA